MYVKINDRGECMKTKKLFIIIFMLVICINSAYAKCDNEKIVQYGKDAAAIKISSNPDTYKSKPGEYAPPDNYEGERSTFVKELNMYKIQFLNIPDGIKIKLVNDDTKEEQIISYEDTNNGSYTIEIKNVSKIYNYSYSILTDDFENGCTDDVLLSGKLLIPKFNPYTGYAICNEYPNHQLCAKYVTFDMSSKEFNKEMQEYKAKQEQKEEKKEQNKKDDLKTMLNKFYKENKSTILMLGSVIALALIALIIIAIIKRRKRVI